MSNTRSKNRTKSIQNSSEEKGSSNIEDSSMGNLPEIQFLDDKNGRERHKNDSWSLLLNSKKIKKNKKKINERQSKTDSKSWVSQFSLSDYDRSIDDTDKEEEEEEKDVRQNENRPFISSSETGYSSELITKIFNKDKANERKFVPYNPTKNHISSVGINNNEAQVENDPDLLIEEIPSSKKTFHWPFNGDYFNMLPKITNVISPQSHEDLYEISSSLGPVRF